MRPMPSVLRVLCALLLVSLVAVGCKGYRANTTLKKTQQLLVELEGLNAATHAPDQLASLRSLIDQANSRLNAGEAGEAFSMARDAQSTAQQLLIQVEGAEAIALWTKAERDIEVAETNALNRLDVPRYQRIIDLRNEANQARSNNQNRQVIALAREISQEVNTGVAPLRLDAEREQLRASGELDNLRVEGGQRYDPESVISVQNTIARANQKYEQDRDYVLAQNLYSEATRQALEGIERVRRAQGKERMDEIEALLAESLDEGAIDFYPQEYEIVISLLEGINVDFEQELFSKVIQSTTDLRPRAEALKINTKRRAAERRMANMRRDIETLTDGGAREYLPGRIEALDQQLVSARRLFEEVGDEGAFDQIRAMYAEHQNTVELIDREFSTIANDTIRLATGQVETTDTIYRQTARFFAPAPGEIPEDMITFEQNKELRRIQIGEELAAARRELGEAQARVGTRQYRQAILLAQDQSDIANNLLGEIYRTVAGNAVIELSNLISRYERDGARIYAPEELARSNADLQRVKDAMNISEFVLASELAGAARANIELLQRRISGRAVEDIRTARDLLGTVDTEKTRLYADQQLTHAQRLIGEAEVALQQGHLKPALEAANEAIAQSRSAMRRANEAAAREAISNAEETIERARVAGADLYAGRDMESARRIYDSSRALLIGGDPVKSEELALTAIERANAALYKKVDDAETAIADAKAVGGWEYDNRNLSAASARAREARLALDAGNHQQSASLADSALGQAVSVGNATKRNNYSTAVRRIRENLEEGRLQGINYFQVQDSIEMRQRLATIQSRWTLENYDDVMSDLLALEGDLRATLDDTGEIVTTVAQQQNVRLDRLVEEGATTYAGDLVVRAREQLKFAEMDYRNGQYRSAHGALRTAIRDINEIQRRSDHESYVAQITAVFDEFSIAQERFGSILRLEPSELKALARSATSRSNMVSLASQATPSDFRDAVDRQYSTVVRIQPPASMVQVHETVITAFNEARLAATHFEKLIILNEVGNDEAERVIDQAYMRINRANRIVGTLQREFFNEEVRVRLVSASDLIPTGTR